MKAIAELFGRIAETRKDLTQLQEDHLQMSQEERQKLASGRRESAEVATKRAEEFERNAEAENEGIGPLQRILTQLDDAEHKLSRQSAVFQVHELLLDAERHQVVLMIMALENVISSQWRQAYMERELADFHLKCADVLVPPQQSFWERQRKIINSIGIVGAAVAINYAVKLVIWVIQRLLTYLRSTRGRGRSSIRRLSTLLSFAGSIVKLFVWVFAAITVLSEFGVDPAKSTGAIGLIGLIMAGMFQQIVVDFVKGLDIVAGGHYSVGDFVEVDGKRGHVVHFNVKHTRIRTLSGQEFNIPNSRCVPSRRFPDGYVANYVDITLKSSTDEDRAKTAIDDVCSRLNQRIEAIRDEPVLADRFDTKQGILTLRYRVRVLPGCDWVVTDYFIPAVKEALATGNVELSGEPTFFFINRIETFRKLFSRRLSEDEIIQETSQVQSDLPDEEGHTKPIVIDAETIDRRESLPKSGP